MKQKHDGKKKRTSVGSLAIRLTVITVSAYLLVSLVSGQLQVSQKRAQLDELSAKVETLAQQNAELERLMSTDDENAYIERMAREKLGFARPEERIFVDISGQ